MKSAVSTTTTRVTSGRWLRPPRLRTLEHGTGHRHASWLELFYDLVLVVAIAQSAHLFVHHPGAHGALAAGGFFVAVFLAWQGFVAYADRFDSDDAPLRIATFAQMLALLALSIQMRDVVAGNHIGFALAFALMRAILVALYLRAYIHSKPARPLIRRYGGVYSVSVVLWCLSALLPVPLALGLWATAIVLDLSVPPLSTRLHRSVPTDPAHLPERFGLFTLIVLGELIVTAGIGAMEATWSGETACVAVFGFGAAACLWWIYFERLAEQELPRSAVPVIAFAYAHLPLLAGLMYVAGGTSVLIDPRGEAAIASGAWALCGGVAVFLVAICVAHRQLVASPQPRILVLRILAAALVCAVPLFARTSVLATGAVFAVLLAVVITESFLCYEDGAVNAEGEGISPAKTSPSTAAGRLAE